MAIQIGGHRRVVVDHVVMALATYQALDQREELVLARHLKGQVAAVACIEAVASGEVDVNGDIAVTQDVEPSIAIEIIGIRFGKGFKEVIAIAAIKQVLSVAAAQRVIARAAAHHFSSRRANQSVVARTRGNGFEVGHQIALAQRIGHHTRAQVDHQG